MSGGKKWGVTPQRGGISCCEENILKLIVVMVSQFFGYTKKSLTYILFFKATPVAYGGSKLGVESEL